MTPTDHEIWQERVAAVMADHEEARTDFAAAVTASMRASDETADDDLNRAVDRLTFAKIELARALRDRPRQKEETL